VARRNPIHVIGDPIRKGVTWLSDELIRDVANDDALGSDGFVVMAFMLSCASAPDSKKRPWETSAAEISEKFGWGQNRERAKRAIERAVKDNRLIIRGYIRDGQELDRNRYRAYIVCAGGRRFTDEEQSRWSRPKPLPPKAPLPIRDEC
jgi:hypothetical protein